MPDNKYTNELKMLQVKADLSLAKMAIEEAEGTKEASYAKYLKGLAGYHLQQATEKLIKIQIYHSGVEVNHSKIYKHSIQDLIAYARSLEISFEVPEYVDTNAPKISAWEAEGRYDVHVVVRIDVLKKAQDIVADWYENLKVKGYK